MNTKLLRTILLALCLIVTTGALAQKAPNPFSSAGFTHRLKSFQLYGQRHYYEYTPSGLLATVTVKQEKVGFEAGLREESEEGTLLSISKFFYDKNGYLERIDLYGRPRVATGEFDIITRQEKIFRDDNGYITRYERYDQLGTDPDDEELTKVIDCSLSYNDKHQAIKADISILQEDGAFPIPVQVCNVTYNESGLVKKVSQIDPDDNGEMRSEEFEYDEQNRLTKSISNSTKDGKVIITYQYDEKGNMYKAGRENFEFDYTYGDLYPMEQTYIPTRKTIAHCMVEEFRNCFAFSSYTVFPIKSGSKMAPIAENDEPIEYEQVVLSNDMVKNVVNSDLFPSVQNGILKMDVSQEFVGKALYLYDIAGNPLVRITLKESNEINLQHLPAGVYMLKSGESIAKIVI